MKKFIYTFFLLTFTLLGFRTNAYEITGLVGTPTDYSKYENWMYFNTNPEASVDMIFFYPTVVNESKTGYLGKIDEDMKKGAHHTYDWMGSTFAPYTNVFAPYYRQIPLDKVAELKSTKEYVNKARTTEVRTDVFASLDEYFTKYNNNRPFILAGHSQGSAVLSMVMDDYMKAHPEYLNRMIAAYLIGFPVTKEWLSQNPHLKFAQGETDTGVIVSWNTEGPKPTMENFLTPEGTLAINPLNWKLDETPATVQENKGNLNRKTMMIDRPGSADATLDLGRGAVICTTITDYVPESLQFAFGDQSLHTYDYTAYYANIRENGQKRIDAYLKKHQPTDYSRVDNWMHMETNPTHPVDLIYFYPTSTLESPDGSGVGVINDENKKRAQNSYNRSGSAFSAYTNVFAPYYRQMAFSIIPTFKDGIKDSKEFIENNIPKVDAFAALDYYFNHLNNGRPFIISGHSQGSTIAQLAFEEYFSKHPEYLKRMVAAYIIGWPVTEKWLADNNLKFATGETDTGVIITWNTEGPNSTGGSDNTWLAINPINWKTDETPAAVSENKGTLHYSEFNLEKGVADATIDKERGTVICTTQKNYVDVLAPVFGDKNLHFYDYNLYYGNIKENGQKRIDAYLKEHSVK